MAASEISSILSVLDLEDELTCSICLSPFVCPVTLPCGHNFCQSCVDLIWKDTVPATYLCPQCRMHFDTKPELKKNTVLSAVVETLKGTRGEPDPLEEKGDTGTGSPCKEAEPAILCDTCMVCEALHTCLTCMASFCEEHVRPHHDNPNFRSHQLSAALGDLCERMCPEHHKLMEFFCTQHRRCICSLCLQQVHRSCSFSTPEEQRGLKESDLKTKLRLLDVKIEKNQTVISQIRAGENTLKDLVSSKKKMLEAEHQEIRELLERELSDGMNMLDRELQSSQTKTSVLVNRLTQNVQKMNSAKGDIDTLLAQSQTLAFLQASVDLPSEVKFDPFIPRVTIDSKAVSATQAFALILKEHLADLLKLPVEARLARLKPGTAPQLQLPRNPQNPGPGAPPAKGRQKKNPQGCSQEKALAAALDALMNSKIAIAEKKTALQRQAAAGSNTGKMRGACSIENLLDGNKKGTPPGPRHPAKPEKTNNPQQQAMAGGKMRSAGSFENLLDGSQKGKTKGPKHPAKPETFGIPPNIASAEKRHELLKYSTVLTLDPLTAHKRIRLTDDLATACVTDDPVNYPNNSARFSVCSQVLASQGFSRGRHYWEVKMSSNNFVAIGLAYGSIDRKSAASRLGRSPQSWCVEWFNVKLTAWHSSKETVLENPDPKRVGVLLDCDEGVATFYNVSDRAYPFHSFIFPFAETVYPAFWVFSSGSSITLCKLQA